MKNKNKILKEAGVLLITTFMILTAVTVSANTYEKSIDENHTLEAASFENPHTRDVVFEDDFESYADFVLDFPPWTQYDGDLMVTWGFETIDFPNEHYIGAYIIFNPSQCTPPLQDPAHSGDKYAACFDGEPLTLNDDWLITPQLYSDDFDDVSFWAKTGSAQYEPDRFEVGVSTTDNDPSSFTMISTPPYVEPPTTWTQYTYNLDNYDGQSIYIAIHCVNHDSFWLGIDDFMVTGAYTPDPLEADADGPYDALVGEDIQFEGTASGGVSPYTYHWDFGDGNTSEEEDPVHAYGEADVYTVNLTVTDSERAVAWDETTATITLPPPPPAELEITEIAGGMGVTATIKNVGESTAENLEWNIKVTGGFLGLVDADVDGNKSSLAVNATEDAASGSLGFLHLGGLDITVTAEADNADAVSKDYTAFIIGPFVLSVAEA